MVRQGYTVKGGFVLFTRNRKCKLYRIDGLGEKFLGVFESRDKAEKFSEQDGGKQYRIEDEQQ